MTFQLKDTWNEESQVGKGIAVTWSCFCSSQEMVPVEYPTGKKRWPKRVCILGYGHGQAPRLQLAIFNFRFAIFNLQFSVCNFSSLEFATPLWIIGVLFQVPHRQSSAEGLWPDHHLGARCGLRVSNSEAHLHLAQAFQFQSVLPGMTDIQDLRKTQVPPEAVATSASAFEKAAWL